VKEVNASTVLRNSGLSKNCQKWWLIDGESIQAVSGGNCAAVVTSTEWGSPSGVDSPCYVSCSQLQQTVGEVSARRPSADVRRHVPDTTLSCRYTNDDQQQRASTLCIQWLRKRGQRRVHAWILGWRKIV